MISSARALRHEMNLKEEAQVKLYRAYGYGFSSLSKNNMRKARVVIVRLVRRQVK